MKTLLPLTACVVFCASSAPAGDFVLSLTGKGAAIDVPGAGRFVIPAPVLSMAEDDYKGQDPQLEIENGVLVARYESGAELRIRVPAAEPAVEFEMSGVPAGAKGFRFQTIIPLEFNQGGRFAFGDRELAPIPEAPKGQFLQQGTAGRFVLVDALGHGFTVTTPESWQGLQDNRQFNWPAYAWLYLYDFKKHAGQNSFQFRFAPPER